MHDEEPVQSSVKAPYLSDPIVKWLSRSALAISILQLVLSMAAIYALSHGGMEWLKANWYGGYALLKAISADIPVAWRPAAWLIERGQYERAEFISIATALCWSVSLIEFGTATLLLIMKRQYIKGKYDSEWPMSLTSRSMRPIANDLNMYAGLFFLGLFLFYISYYGNFNFDYILWHNNNVHIDGTHLYLLPLKLLALSVVTKLLLFGGVPRVLSALK